MISLSRPYIGEEEKQAVLRVLDSGMLAQGPEVEAFEEEFSEYVEGQHCIAVNSGTSALHIGLLAAGIQPGDEVIVPSFTFAATANAVSLCGATPVFVDIDPVTFTMSVEAAEAAITNRTTAVMPVHLYGHPADMDSYVQLSSKRGLLLCEDAAQAHLASWDGIPVGTFGLGTFSFYPTKNMTSGEGGMIVTSSEETARRARLFRNQGMEQRYRNEVIGLNNRMTDLHAAIGRVQLNRLEGFTARRREIAGAYGKRLETVGVPEVSPKAVHAYHQYTIRSENRDSLSAHLDLLGIGNGVYYPIPVHELPSFGEMVDLPETTRASHEVLSIPIHPFLSSEDIDEIVEAINSWC